MTDFNVVKEMPYVGAFDLAEQRVVVYTKSQWYAFVSDVMEQMGSEYASDEELLECWNDEFFWNYL